MIRWERLEKEKEEEEKEEREEEEEEEQKEEKIWEKKDKWTTVLVTVGTRALMKT